MKIIKIKDMRREKKARNKVSSKALQHKKEEFEFEIEKGVRKTLLSSCFYIVPVKIATAEDHKIEESKDIRFFGDVMEYRKEAISIEDEYVSQFLCYFLNKNCDKDNIWKSMNTAEYKGKEYVTEIILRFDDGNGLMFYGWIDFCHIVYVDHNNVSITKPFREVASSLFNLEELVADLTSVED